MDIFTPAVSQEKIISFTKQLYFLISAGVPLYRSIQIIHAQTTDQGLKTIVQACLDNLAEGKSFTECILAFPKNFSPFYVTMITVGESRGQLEASLQRTYQYLESMRELREKAINALTYPAILLVVGTTVLMSMLFFVLPKFAEIFNNAQVVLPLPTRILLGIHAVLTHHAIALVVGLIAVITGVIFAFNTPSTRYTTDTILLRIPVIGQLWLLLRVARFCRTLGVLYNSGVQLLPALDLSKHTLSNMVLEKEIDTVSISVREGKGIARTISKSKLFPPMMSQMIAVGEETGVLEKVLLDVAVYYEQETDFAMKRALALIEPCALIVISLFVTLIASAVLLPLFRMSSAIRGL